MEVNDLREAEICFYWQPQLTLRKFAGKIRYTVICFHTRHYEKMWKE